MQYDTRISSIPICNVLIDDYFVFDMCTCIMHTNNILFYLSVHIYLIVMRIPK